MSLFITQCPHCHTAFRTSISQLQSADGMVRCGACLRVFAADDHLLPSADLRTISRPLHDPDEEDEGLEEQQEQENQLEIGPLAATEGEADDATLSDDSIFTLDLADSLPNRISPSISEHSSFWEILDEDTLEPHSAQGESLAAADAPLPPDDEQTQESHFGEHEDIAPLSQEEPGQDTTLPEPEPEPEASEDPFEDELNAPAPASIGNMESAHTESVDAPEEEPGTPDFPPFAPQAIANDEATARSRMRALRFDDDVLEDTQAPALSEDDIQHVSGADTPLELHWQESGGPGKSQALFATLSLVLLISLGLQWLWFNRDTLSQNPRWRPYMDSLCERLRCELPVLTDIRAIHSDALEVRSHPEISNALSVQFVFRNDAGFAQPFPGLYLRFTDADNKVVAERRFLPQEYLPQGVADLRDMPPEAPVQVALAILDPGARAVNYEVSFYTAPR